VGEPGCVLARVVMVAAVAVREVVVASLDEFGGIRKVHDDDPASAADDRVPDLVQVLAPAADVGAHAEKETFRCRVLVRWSWTCWIVVRWRPRSVEAIGL